MVKVLVTGGCGFIGSNFIRYVLEVDPEAHVTNFDALTSAGNPQNLADLQAHPRYRFQKGDVTSRPSVEAALRQGFDAVIHFAA